MKILQQLKENHLGLPANTAAPAPIPQSRAAAVPAPAYPPCARRRSPTKGRPPCPAMPRQTLPQILPPPDTAAAPAAALPAPAETARA